MILFVQIQEVTMNKNKPENKKTHVQIGTMGHINSNKTDLIKGIEKYLAQCKGDLNIDQPMQNHERTGKSVDCMNLFNGKKFNFKQWQKVLSMPLDSIDEKKRFLKFFVSNYNNFTPLFDYGCVLFFKLNIVYKHFGNYDRFCSVFADLLEQKHIYQDGGCQGIYINLNYQQSKILNKIVELYDEYERYRANIDSKVIVEKLPEERRVKMKVQIHANLISNLNNYLNLLERDIKLSEQLKNSMQNL